MRILVFSDSHKSINSMIAVTKNLVGVDMIIHAGDHASDAESLQNAFPDIPVKYVSGNCDFSNVPSETVIEADGKRIFITHGHNYRVKYEADYLTLFLRATELNSDCVVFGHTHLPFCDINKGITLLNPGSIKSRKTYGVIETENGKLKACICDASYIV